MQSSLEDNDNQTLTLQLSISSTPPQPQQPPPPPPRQPPYEPSLTLSLSGARPQRLRKVEEPPCSAASSAPTGFVVVSVKRERESGSEEDVDQVDKSGGGGGGGCNNYYSVSRGGSDEDEEGVGPTVNGGCSTRKKLRLTKDQSALLEESFKLHSTLNPKQKQALADRLKLRPRQVEVWFQNRRARTKLKQTEVDCEYLKKCCETLTDENRRLHKELQELKALKMGAQPLYMHIPAATLTMCPSCERIGTPGAPIAGAPGSTNTPFVAMGSKPPFYTSFTNSSAAC